MSKMFIFVSNTVLVVLRKKLIMQVVYPVYPHYPGLDNVASNYLGIYDSHRTYNST